MILSTSRTSQCSFGIIFVSSSLSLRIRKVEFKRIQFSISLGVPRRSSSSCACSRWSFLRIRSHGSWGSKRLEARSAYSRAKTRKRKTSCWQDQTLCHSDLSSENRVSAVRSQCSYSYEPFGKPQHQSIDVQSDKSNPHQVWRKRGGLRPQFVVGLRPTNKSK